MSADVIETGIVVELNGLYWGIQENGGNYSHYGYGDAKKATLLDPRYAKAPSDFAYNHQHSYIAQLNLGTLRLVQRTTTITIV